MQHGRECKKSVQIKSVTGDIQEGQGTVEIEIKVGDYHFSLNAIIAKIEPEILIGMPFFSFYKAEIKPASNQLTLKHINKTVNVDLIKLDDVQPGVDSSAPKTEGSICLGGGDKLGGVSKIEGGVEPEIVIIEGIEHVKLSSILGNEETFEDILGEGGVPPKEPQNNID